MKKRKSRYKLTEINPKFYEKINTENLGEHKALTQEEFEGGMQGIIYAPYILITTEDCKPSKEYTKFMKQYKKNHEVCPKCGSKSHSTTLVDYVFYADKKEDYKDLNLCICSDCGDRHTMHERVNVRSVKK